MKLRCKIFGHDYREKLVKLDKVVKNKGLSFDPKICSDVAEFMKRKDENPLKEYECERCGVKLSYVNKFLNLYRR